MTDDQTTTPPTAPPTGDKPPAPSRKVTDFAKLVRGTNYALKFEGQIHRWAIGEEKKVSPDLRAYLEKTALDVVTVNGGENDVVNETRPKFAYDRR